MGLFGARSSISRIATGGQDNVAERAIKNIAGQLEAELRDTPGEYFVLQAAGMLFASESRTFEGHQPVGTMKESISQARQLMLSFSDVSSTDASTLASKAAGVYSQLHAAVGAGAPPSLLVSYLNSYLHHVANVYLKRRAPSDTRYEYSAERLLFDERRNNGGSAARMPMLAVFEFVALFVFGLGAAALIGFTFPVFLAVTVTLGLFGFSLGKSTKVPENPREVPFSPMATLSYREFDSWARQNDLQRTDPAFFSRNDIHWTEKLPVLFSGSDATGHCFEPSRSTTTLILVDLALGAFVFVPAVRAAFVATDSRQSLVFQVMCGLAVGQVAGRAVGHFYRWFRGQM